MATRNFRSVLRSYLYASAILMFFLFKHDVLAWNADNSSCVEPADLNFEVDITETHETFNMLQGYSNARWTTPNDIAFYTHVTRSSLPGQEKSCNRASQPTDEIHKLSTCPWHYVTNYDPNRRPEVIFEAKCNCRPHRPCLNGVLLSSSVIAHRHRCSEPTTLPVIEFEDYIDIVWTGSNSGRPGFTSGLINATIEVPAHTRHRSHRSHRVHDSNTINALSTCRWTYTVERVRDRKPEGLTQAVCVDRRSNSGNLCEPLVRYIVVYKRNGCVEGVWQYRQVWQPITVACVEINDIDYTRSAPRHRVVSPY
ncbi:hypothetical protein ACF0H5_018722 [Mactra antiquata]